MGSSKERGNAMTENPAFDETRTEPLYQRLARLVDAVANCKKHGNDVWEPKHRALVETLVERYMPSGSGFDAGTKIDWQRSGADRLVFTTSYHHMNDGGFYDGWTEHVVTVKPSLAFGISLSVGGRDRGDIKNYIGDCFDEALCQHVSDGAVKRLAECVAAS
jgi:hypothetical protein